MSRETERPVTPVNRLPRTETRRIEVPFTDDGEGNPIVVVIRGIPQMAYLEPIFQKMAKAEEGAPLTPETLAVYRRMAEICVIEPRFDFSDDPTKPQRWDDLLFEAQVKIIEEIGLLTSEGSQKAEALRQRFRDSEPQPGRNGVDATGGRHDEVVPSDGGTAAPAA
jgi:hypothetical protein